MSASAAEFDLRAAPRTPIHDAIIEDSSAWTAASLGGRIGLEHRLEKPQLDAIDELLETARSLPRRGIGRAQFDHPRLTPFLTELREEIFRGKCAAVVTGVDPSAYSSDDLELIFWGIGAHLGGAAVQSRRADRIGYVQHEPDDPLARGYRGSGELVLHTDSRPIIALMCMSCAEQGGRSRLASATTIHNVVLRERPDLLAPLYRGFPYFSGEIDAILPAIPVYSTVEDALSCFFFEDHMRRAARVLGQNLPADLEDAIAFFKEVADRQDICLDFMLNPGEMLFSNNFVILHARTAFRDSERNRRRLLRLWISPSPARPVISELLERSRRFDALFDPDVEHGSSKDDRS